MKSIIWSLASIALLGCGSSDKGIAIHNTRPEVSFEEPEEAQTFEVGEPVAFLAFVTDKESDPEDLELEWVSDLDGLLEDTTTPSVDGEALFVISALSEGTHTITLKVTDPQGQIGSDYMTVNLESNCFEFEDCDFDEDGYTEEEGDCDDDDADRNPGVSEYYNEIDDDCDGLIDEGTAAYDDDGDGYAEFDGDCDDADPEVSPGAMEAEDGIDNDCDDLVDEGTDIFDDDGDGYSEAEGDCDDTIAAVSPEAEELANGIDDDCDGLVDEGSAFFDDDGDGYAETEGDCDDADPSVSPLAAEVCDGIDNDCDGAIDAEDLDTDHDGDGFSVCDFDCDDTDPDVHPDAPEICDEIDNDCDEEVDADDDDTDMDGDGYGLCDEAADCDDDDEFIHPGATEICDILGIDENCDGRVNEDGADGGREYHRDFDGDGYGASSGLSLTFCSPPEGYVDNDEDCDDTRSSVNPDGTEACGDGLDNDCNGLTDAADPAMDQDADGSTLCDAVPDCDDTNARIYPGAIEVCDFLNVDEDCDGEANEPGAEGSETFFADLDGDGFGDPDSTGLYCEVPGSGYVDNDEDCDDTRPAVNPDGTEACDDGLDNDCNGFVDEEDPAMDQDVDGSTLCDVVPDCDDFDEAIFPGALEVCDGRDNDCDGRSDEAGAVGSTGFFADADGDGFGVATSVGLFCDLPEEGYAVNALDCDDTNALVNPASTELCGDGIDNDCDFAVDGYDPDTDADGDGFSACAPVEANVDCDDADPDINPDADEVCGDEKDNDCDESVDEEGADGSVIFYADSDDDGYGDEAITVLACSVPSGFVTNDDDCNDVNPDIRPGATEVCDGVDNNCDTDIDLVGVVDAPTWYLDADGDDYGSSAVIACDPPAGNYVSIGDDCNDGDATVYPGATEYCDGRLNNCDLSVGDGDEAVDRTEWYLDGDDDGFPDSAVSVFACEKPDGYLESTALWDCNDDDPGVYAGSAEVCDGVDNDCDGVADEAGADGCSNFYRDADGDGYGTTEFRCLCEAGDEPDFDVTDSTDCYDENSAAYPEATTYRTENREGDPDIRGSYDYNCRDGEEKKWTASRGDCSLLGDWGDWFCSAGDGFSGSAPDCGDTKTWYSNCRYKGGLSLSCEWSTSERTQECR